MKILIIHSHNANRGDEAAVKAMVDELLLGIPDLEITISINGATPYPNMPPQVTQIGRFPKLRSRVAQLEFFAAKATKGRLVFTKEGKQFIKALKEADLVLHAPGGPSIGDIYANAEMLYLWRLDLVRKLNKPYMFYAPSMGPFNMEERNKLRKKVLLGARKIILRDPISVGYVREFIPEKEVSHALDSALQHDIDIAENEAKYNAYTQLVDFVGSHEKCIGVTITDLKWHPKHKNSDEIKAIFPAFRQFIEHKVSQGYGIVFIPQLYGTGNDTVVMNEYMLPDHTFMIDAANDEYDSYFQQYVIGRLYAVVGMRYHSNIFSVKMGTPFVSVSYEQKMKGFMQSVGLEQYCVDLSDINEQLLEEKFSLLENNYDEYKNMLKDLHGRMKAEAYRSTEAVISILEGK